MDLNEAIKAHSDWKIKLRGAIVKQEKLDVATIARDDCCALGKWLHGDSRKPLGGLASHANCLKLHADFHRQASKVASTINAGQYAQAEQLLVSGSPYAKASNDVVMAIGTLKREARL